MHHPIAAATAKDSLHLWVDHSAVEVGDAVGTARRRDALRDNDLREAAPLAVQSLCVVIQRPVKSGLCPQVERARAVIEQQDFRLADDGPREREPQIGRASCRERV